MEVEQVFESACEQVKELPHLSQDSQLHLYGLFKQGKFGDCCEPKPGFFDFRGKAKWAAWDERRGMSKEEAMNKYIRYVHSKLPQEGEDVMDDAEHETNPNTISGPVQSSLMYQYEEDDDVSSGTLTVFDLVRNEKSSWEDIVAKETSIQTLLSLREDDGCTLLHIACDRGRKDIAEALLDLGMDINLVENDGCTGLHYATTCNHKEIVELLLTRGCDTSIEDKDGTTAEECADDSDIIELFSKYK
eukprot:m.41291 g.41291  ORF g.41291 m.41291 type:complete len:246 (-) comp6992_c0_seq1:1009-1746(-)